METELKFQVPAARRDALLRAVSTATAQRTRLQAVYFDTVDQRLAAAGIALRLRKEGRVWVQTVKSSAGAGAGSRQEHPVRGSRQEHAVLGTSHRHEVIGSRHEHEVRLPPQRGEPQPDPRRHAGSPAGDALAAMLAASPSDPAAPAPVGGAELQPLFRADVRRLHRIVRYGGALIEIAYDRGSLLAGPRRQPLDEIEFEIKSGPPQALAALAQRWVARFGLWWDVRPKSEQGLRLARDEREVPAVKAAASDWPHGATPAQVWSAALQSALAQALPNAAEIASGKAGPEHLHQLRVALRRLRAALRVFSSWGGDAAAALALEAEWRVPFGVLGAARDADVLAKTLGPQLLQAGAPPLALPAVPPGAEEPADCIRGASFNTLLLRTLALAWQTPAAAIATQMPLPAAARAVLRPAWRKLLRDADQLAGAAPAARHRTRKRLKRFRYALEFLLPLFPCKPARRLQRALADALSALGDLNDIEVAYQRSRQQALEQPQAWFAVGWLAAQRDPALQRAQAAMRSLKSAPRPWHGK